MSDITGADGGLHVLPYLGTAPRFAGPVLHAGPGAAVLGRAIVGRDAWFGARAVVRADGETVTIGDGFHMGARGTVHIATDEYATSIGDGVTAGPGAVIHACAVGSGCWIGAGAVILDGSRLAVRRGARGGCGGLSALRTRGRMALGGRARQARPAAGTG